MHQVVLGNALEPQMLQCARECRSIYLYSGPG